jgi:hypothetical protein
VHEIVERYAVETIVAKNLQYNFLKNWEANISTNFISKLLKNSSPFWKKLNLKFGGATLLLVYASNFFWSPTRDNFNLFFVFSQNFKMQQIIYSYFQSQTINSNFHHTSLVKDHWSTLSHLKKIKSVNLWWNLRSTPHIP